MSIWHASFVIAQLQVRAATLSNACMHNCNGRHTRISGKIGTKHRRYEPNVFKWLRGCMRKPNRDRHYHSILSAV